jgi:hypothetical protein
MARTGAYVMPRVAATVSVASDPKLYRIGRSPLSEKVYAGWARGMLWVGPKRDVTQSFLSTVIDWLGGERVVSGQNTIKRADGTSWTVTLRKVKPKKPAPRPARAPKKPAAKRGRRKL